MEEKVISQVRAIGAQGDVYTAESDSTVVRFRASNYHSTETRNRKGIGLRLVAGGRLGFCSTTDPSRVDDLVETARAVARFGDTAHFVFPAAAETRSLPLTNPHVAALETATVVRLGRDLVNALVARVPDMKVDLSLSKATGRTTLANTSGLRSTFYKTDYALSMEGLIIVDGSLVWLYDYANLAAGKPLDVAQFVERNGKLADQARRKVELKTGHYPVVFMPFAVSDVFAPLPSGVNGKMFQKKITPLLEKEAQTIADPKLSVYDDPLIEFAAGSGPFDGDGMASRRTPVIEQGVFKNFLFDLQTAGSVQRSSTTSARRGYAGLPSPGFANFVVAPGAADLDRTIAGIDEGLLVYAVVGGGQSNLLAGDFSFDVSIGFKIEKGSIVGRVKGAMIAGNFYEAVEDIAGLGNTPWDLGTQHLPFVHFSDLSIAAKE